MPLFQQSEPEYPQVQENFWSPGILAFRSTRHEDHIIDEYFDQSGAITRRNTTRFDPPNWREAEEYWEDTTEEAFVDVTTFGETQPRRVLCEISSNRQKRFNGRLMLSDDELQQLGAEELDPDEFLPNFSEAIADEMGTTTAELSDRRRIRLERMWRLVETGLVRLENLRGISNEEADELLQHFEQQQHIRRYQRWRIEIPNRDLIYPVGLPTPRRDVSRGDVNPTGLFETVRAMAIAIIELVNSDGDLVNLELPISNLSIIQARTVDIVTTVLSRRVGFDRYGQATIDECAIAGDVIETSNSSRGPLCQLALRLRVEELRVERRENSQVITFEVPVRRERRRSPVVRVPANQVWVRSPLDEYWMGADFSLNPPQNNPDITQCPAICSSCRNFHGESHGGNFLVCGIHPYGNGEDCTDFEVRENG